MVTEKEYVIVTGASGRFGSIISKLLAEEESGNEFIV